MSFAGVFALGLVYVLVARWLVRSELRGRDMLFALLNLGAIALVYFPTSHDWRLLVEYVAVVSVQYLAFRRWGRREDGREWIAFALPIAVLAVHLLSPFLLQLAVWCWPVDVLPSLGTKLKDLLAHQPEYKLGQRAVGLSYLCFRSAYLVLEVRNRTAPAPGYWQYLGFAFFAPTLTVGPISPYREHHRGFTSERPDIAIGNALLRVMLGLVKYMFLASVVSPLTYSGLLFDGVGHSWTELGVAAAAYYLFLYCNFSGFCDLAVGIAGLIGIPVAENFDNPFAARNLKEFWNRWHITLSHFMRDVVFSPLSKFFARILGPRFAMHAVVVPIFAVFLLIGIWHGLTWPYAVFGVIQAVGLSINHYYSLWLKRRLGSSRYVAYQRNRYVQLSGVVLTNTYFGASLFYFANSAGEIHTILSGLGKG